MPLLPAPIAALVEKQFLQQLVSTPRGRATLLSQVARSEGTDGETGVFEHILRSIDDEEVLLSLGGDHTERSRRS